VAGEVRLFEHDDFEQAMLNAAERFAVSEQFVEKDYYVTEILRIVTDRLGDKVIFKGGTSLSKGWDLITRFSEDIDLFVNPDKFDPRPGKKKMDGILKGLSAAVEEHPALTWLKDEGTTIGGSSREDYFEYRTHFPALPRYQVSGAFGTGCPKRRLSDRGGSHHLAGRQVSPGARDGRHCRGLGRVRDDIAALQADLRGEVVHTPREGGPAVGRGPPDRARRPPLFGPLRFGG